MKVFHSPFSPFVRKVLVCAAELDIAVEQVPSQLNPLQRDAVVAAANPLSQLPTLIDDAGAAYFDSRVICEYLDEPYGRLFPAGGAARWQALREQALADGLVDAALLMRYEAVLREPERRSDAWCDGQQQKVTAALEGLARWADGFGERVDIGTISVACALSYLDLRFPGEDWRRFAPLAAWHGRFRRARVDAGNRASVGVNVGGHDLAELPTIA